MTIRSQEHAPLSTASSADNSRSQHSDDWLSRPLCCSYAFAEFRTLRLPVRDGDAVKDIHWRWALGLFKQDEYEVLGAWPAQVVPALVAQDLQERGIEHIKAIAAEGGADFVSQYPDAAPWPSVNGIPDAQPRGAARVFGPRRRAALQSAAATARRLQTSITRAIKRRAPFANEAAAADFLALALQDADRRFYAA